MERKYCVYKHTSPNGKVYIGLTGQKPELRWMNGNGYTGSNHFDNAIKKYGWKNMESEILHDNLTREEACEVEIEEIRKHKATDENYGYNLRYGGESNVPTQETINKIIESNVANGNWVGFEEARAIREDYNSSTLTQKQLANKYGVSRGLIRDVVNNYTYYDENFKNTREIQQLTPELAKQLREEFSEDVPMSYYAKKYKSSKENIMLVVRNKLWYDENYIVALPPRNKNKDIVENIREKYNGAESISFNDIANEFDLSVQSANDIFNNKTYYE